MPEVPDKPTIVVIVNTHLNDTESALAVVQPFINMAQSGKPVQVAAYGNDAMVAALKVPLPVEPPPPTPPLPPPPPTFVATHAVTPGVDANLRDEAGKEAGALLAGTKVKLLDAAPSTIGGWQNRVRVRAEGEAETAPPRNIWFVRLEKLASGGGDGAPLAWPTEFRIVTQPWGADPAYYGQFGLPGHEGLDLRAPDGSQVFAAGAGVVTRVDAAQPAYGVSVRHAWDYQGRRFEVIYAHGLPESVRVKVGDPVRAGDVLMRADSTGNVRGAHLHLSLKELGVTYEDYGLDGKRRMWPNNLCDPSPYLGL